METNSVSAFQNYQNLPGVIAKGTEKASVNSQPMENRAKLCFGYSVMMIMPNEETKSVYQVVRYMHSSRGFPNDIRPVNMKLKSLRKHNIEIVLRKQLKNQ